MPLFLEIDIYLIDATRGLTKRLTEKHIARHVMELDRKNRSLVSHQLNNSFKKKILVKVSINL